MSILHKIYNMDKIYYVRCNVLYVSLLVKLVIYVDNNELLTQTNDLLGTLI